MLKRMEEIQTQRTVGGYNDSAHCTPTNSPSIIVIPVISNPNCGTPGGIFTPPSYSK
jgi:hypothetical protein